MHYEFIFAFSQSVDTFLMMPLNVEISNFDDVKMIILLCILMPHLKFFAVFSSKIFVVLALNLDL